MSYIQNYQTHIPFSDKEIEEVVKNSQRSIHKIITRPDGKKEYIFSTKAMLDNKGNPIPIESFLIATGQRVFIEPIIKETLDPEAKLKLWAAKKEWKRENPGHKCVKTNTFKNLKLAIEMSTAINRN